MQKSEVVSLWKLIFVTYFCSSHVFPQMVKGRVDEARNETPFEKLQFVDANTFVDELVQMVDSRFRNEYSDPYQFENSDVFGIHVVAWIEGISGMKRQGGTQLVQRANDTFYLKADIGLNNLAANFTYHLGSDKLFIDGTANATVAQVDIDLELTIKMDATTKILSCLVNELHVRDIGGLTVSVSGSGPLDQLDDVIGNAVTSFVRGIVDGTFKIMYQEAATEIVAAL